MEAQSSQLAVRVPHAATPMRLLFDGRKLGDGGIGVYIDNTLRGLLKQGEIDVTVIGSREQAEQAPWRSDVEWFYDSSKQYSLNEYFLLPRRIDFSAYDLYHSPHYTLPFGIPIPTIVTVHDLIHIDHPEAFYYPFIARRLISSAVARASKVIAVSQDTRQAILNLTKSDSRKIVHVPNAIPHFLTAAGVESASGAYAAQVAERPGVSERYFMSVLSNCKPHKGVADLIKAWSECVERFTGAERDTPCPLLLIAGYGAEAIQRDRGLSDLVQRSTGVRILGAVDQGVLRHLYRSAEALVVPSLAEGFCLPALEAQSVGTRIICRPVPALQELVTEHDLVASDTSISSLSAVLLEAAMTPVKNKVIIRAHVERFGLSRTTEQLRAVYQSVVRNQIAQSASAREIGRI